MAEEYRASGKTRADFCRERRMPVTTLDYYLRRDGAKGKQKLLPVRLTSEATAQDCRFTVTLANGRRLEVGKDFDEEALSRLVAVLERS